VDIVLPHSTPRKRSWGDKIMTTKICTHWTNCKRERIGNNIYCNPHMVAARIALRSAGGFTEKEIGESLHEVEK
jgi:hypothetical protein